LLQLHAGAQAQGLAITLRVYRLLRNWDESQATWNIYSTGNAWGAAGAGGATDIDSTETGSVSVPANPSVGTVIAIPLSPDELVKLIHGSYTNYGWLLKMDSENNDKHNYASSSHATAAYRPKLVIQYSTGAVIPPEDVNRVYNYSQEKPHAVTALSTGEFYSYDANGNMSCRVEAGKYYSQVYNVENRLSTVVLRSISCAGTALSTWNFFYDGDGNRVRQEYFQGIFGQNVTVNVINYYAGGSYETDQTGIVQADSSILIAGTVTRRYYAFASQNVAMIQCTSHGCVGLQYFLTDHLGSVAAVVDANGGLVSQQRYYPYGGVRSDVGTVTQTDFGYTGQRNLDAQGNSYRLGLMDYKARFYDPYLHHFIQPDTMTPGGPQGLNRYAYVGNNPVNGKDPTGNKPCDELDENGKCLGVVGEDAPVVTPIPTATPTTTPTPTTTATATLTVTTIQTAITLLQYSPTGEALYKLLLAEGKTFSYSSDCTGHNGNIVLVPSPSCFDGSPTGIAGTIAHEAFHDLFGNTHTLLEEYQAFLIGDIVRTDLVQKGYGLQSDIRHQLNKYTIDLNNPNKTLLANDLRGWFQSYEPIYILPVSQGGYGMNKYLP